LFHNFPLFEFDLNKDVFPPIYKVKFLLLVQIKEDKNSIVYFRRKILGKII
jgi:hypothetical protein